MTTSQGAVLPLAVAPMSDDLIERLRARALTARGEGTATALGDALHFEEAAAEIERLTAEQIDAHEEAEHFISVAIDRSPDQLRQLGEYLSNVLDEDQFPRADRLLLGIADALAAKDTTLAEITAEHAAARQNFHTMQHAANALRQRAETAEAALSEMRAELERVKAALEITADLAQDAAAGLHYVEHHYGRLSGVGFDRVFEKEAKAKAFLAARALSQDEPADIGVGG